MDNFRFNLMANEFQPQGSTTKNSLFSFNILAPEFQPEGKTIQTSAMGMAEQSHKFNLFADEFYPEINNNDIEEAHKWDQHTSQQMFHLFCSDHSLRIRSEIQTKLEKEYATLTNNEFEDVNKMFSSHYSYGEEEALPVSENSSTSFTPKLIPELYHKVPIVFGKFGMDSFDFEEHNPTSLCGLQGCLPNAYCNAMIQALYYQAGLHQVVLGHCCDMDTCLVCELSFLFHMMDQKSGNQLVQPHNFLRALRTNTEAVARGLVFPNSDSVTASSSRDIIQVVQNWHKFILEQIAVASRDNGSNAFDHSCGLETVTVTTCTNCQSCISVQSGQQIGCDLVYPQDSTRISFEDVLCSSLESSKAMRSALCSHCGHFQPTNLSHSVQSLPESLTVYTGCNESVTSAFWEQQSVHVANEATLTANVYGSKVDQDGDLWDQMRELDVSWIPESLKLQRLADGTLKGGAKTTLNEDGEQVEYELQSVCFTIVDPQTGKASNVVTAIKVGAFNSARLVLPVPSILVYRRVEYNEVSVPFHPKPSPSIGLDIFQPSQGHEGPLSFCPLDDNEVPRAGDLVALDAEFVTLTPEEKSPGRNRRLITVKAAVRLVGRVTCVQGWGPRRGVPFIDDHISCEEEISDYVSKYSGIFPGDLDPTQSSHHLTSLKRTYKKVRHLVDVGCIFVGHGLKNDFDMLGIVVPSDQVVDTVHLFHLPHWRLLSLKFLAWYFLDKHIQKECHNSNEDAVAALELYQIYLDLEAQGTVKATLAKVLDQARLLNWKVPHLQANCVAFRSTYLLY
ncbi:hypothetical protein TCAL_13428 [Tigriopus californicus]|uniref:Exonuclease domain-containing protein n=1 Tax=Tigriopus californicus TaxID=6832 RepID=A0A553PTZ8_TIGCA|nr:hypothetical protein TCAL_13428 [Tigriopus californicus]